ncbi:MAG TPA: hypothetical protein VF933_29005 [Streptosporangiaceae bacterium]
MAPGYRCGFAQRSGDGADGRGGQDQDSVPGIAVEADLGLIEADAVLARPEAFFCRPAQPGGADRISELLDPRSSRSTASHEGVP